MSDQESLDSEESLVMGDYSNRTQAEISATVNSIITRAVRNGTKSRGVNSAMTVQWFRHIHENFTDFHIETLTNIEAKCSTADMDQKLNLM